MKKTKEDLIIENAKLEKDNQEWADANERRKKEFATAFSWISEQTPYNLRTFDEPKIISWEQIFVKIGRLLATKTLYNLEGNVSELESRLNNLETKVFDPTNKSV